MARSNGERADTFTSPTFAKHLASRGWNGSDIELAALKFAVLADGLRVTSTARDRIAAHELGATAPIRTRSGVSGGFDFVLGDDIFVNAPVNEPHCLDSPFTLDWDDGFRVMADGLSVPAKPVAAPSYYGDTTSSGQPCREIAQMCSGDRLCYSLTGPTCSFWPRHARCRYCSIGLNADADAKRRTSQELLEVAALAAVDVSRPARHVLLGGGTPLGRDMGALLSADLASRIRQTTGLPSYVMIAAPLDDHYIEALFDAGVEELGINLEFWDDDSWRRFIPGKLERIGKERYLDAIAFAGATFGPVRARSIVIAGLEPPGSTIRAVEELASRDVMPIISPFRPLVGTDLADARGCSALTYQELFVRSTEIAERYQLPVGPRCVPCQNNVLALPDRPIQ